ncbi:GNAT family N-acetyltransferase [Vibrio coralliilyticus]|uniref:GNAT family N-acetyltransferase n=1 Tax=Vibrio coralliilyticus TaxID=190893 RepID=UPI0003061B57|nr:GNAT family N-acetyltransferase [Vibrio coralliilyticus]
METTQTTQRFEVTTFKPGHTHDVVSLWRDSMQEAIGIPPVHTFESQAFFLNHILPETHSIYVALSNETRLPVAFVAINDSEINQLYVHRKFQSMGIGSQLLAMAKQQSSGRLSLRTFENNIRAQQFYERHGFVAIGGDAENEEGLPDILYEWRR